MKKKPYIGEVGSELVLKTGIDLGTFTVGIRYIKPISQISGIWTGTIFRGNRVYYKFLADDLDEVGVWRFQAVVEQSDGTFKVYGNTTTLEVFELGE